MRLEADHLSFSYRPGAEVLRDVSLSVEDGDVLFVLGANGSGKTTLLDCLGGARTPIAGTVRIDGRPLSEFSPRERAKRIGVVPQLHEPLFPFTVAQAVLMGRAPHLGPLARPGRADWEAVDAALGAVGIAALRDRPYTETSGGERQLVLVARGLAQGARCLLLDEPVAHLDPRHQHDLMAIVRGLREGGFSFVVTSHQPEHAVQYADRVLFLKDGKVESAGAPDEAITEESLRRAYGMEFEIVRAPSGAWGVLPRIRPPSRGPAGAPTPRAVAPSGEQAAKD